MFARIHVSKKIAVTFMILKAHFLPQILRRAPLVVALLGFCMQCAAWSPDGHTAIGVLAMKQLTPIARAELERIIGPLTDEAMIKACSWPDDVRETPEWEWSAPQHYINIPRGESDYREDRDCPDQICATEAIKKYAGQLFDSKLSKKERWQAFAWLCHVTGDLHQPMHAGFADDRGANRVDVTFKGEKMNLHSFWDFSLVNEHAGGWLGMVALLSEQPLKQAPADFTDDMVNQWTNESHALAMSGGYPPARNIDEAFALQSWVLTQQQVGLAANRLASIINTQTACQK